MNPFVVFSSSAATPHSRAAAIFNRARRPVGELAGAKLFEGVRGAKPSDVKALVDTILKVQRLAVDNADAIAELDINPLVVRPKGKGVVALDALVVPR